MKGIYIASDNSIMSKEDLLCWLLFIVQNDKDKRYWNFDELTGGVSEFIDDISYERVKNRFNKITKG